MVSDGEPDTQAMGNNAAGNAEGEQQQPRVVIVG